ncbi:Phox homologous domain-containing protein [Scheffersomyces xylosifermentans]|uniref:Phox homologous domain-containing protein n=1 Tax=Scheffersomyces xylosifermentans TaxID=1304137 RepID=UPI00315CC207
MTEVISIPTTSNHSGVIYYHIMVQLPLRSLSVQRRYSEFEDLLNNLSKDLGISPKDFPYYLPAKRVNWFKTNTDSIVEERKSELTKFLNSLIREPSIQNNDVLHKFLQLPVNFTFNNALFHSNINGKSNEASLAIDYNSIDESNWLEIFRVLKSSIQDALISAKSNPNIGVKIQTRDKINKIYQPAFVNLLKSLNSDLKKNLASDEFSRRQVLLKEVQSNLQNLLSDRSSPGSTSKRVLGGPPQETKDTIGLDNKDLLQRQVQIHQQQDQELEQLRLIVARQRQIGEMINAEVEEQNELLDQFNEEVESTSNKLSSARRKARNLL